MKVTNHHKGNYTFVSPSDSSVMYGTIEMTQKEWLKVVEYLRFALSRAKKANNTYARDALSHVFDWSLPQFAKRYPSNRISVGVHATKIIFKRFKLPRYKHQNYVIVIK